MNNTISDSWAQDLLSIDEECLTPHMKILVLKWQTIQRAMKSKGQVDNNGVVWTSVGYIAKCCGCHYRTMRRTLTMMRKVGYIQVFYKNAGQANQEMGVLMMPCVYDLHFIELPNTNKGKGQRKYIECPACKGRCVKTGYVQVVCFDCGEFFLYDNRTNEIHTHE